MRSAQQGGEGMGDEKAGERKGGKALGPRGPGSAGSALLALRVPWMGKVMPDAIPPRVLTYLHSQDLRIDGSAHRCLPLLPTQFSKNTSTTSIGKCGDRFEVHEFLFVPNCDWNLPGIWWLLL